jgi:hypothetical protein
MNLKRGVICWWCPKTKCRPPQGTPMALYLFFNSQEMRKILVFEVETILTIVGGELFLFILHKLLA